MKQVHVVIPGQPVGKGRPRFGNGRAYTPAKTRDYEKKISNAAYIEMAELEPAATPVRLVILAQFEIPKSWAKWRKEAATVGAYRPGRPDIDNIAKAVLDAFNGIVYVDDAQVYDLQIKKTYGQPLLVVTATWDE